MSIFFLLQLTICLFPTLIMSVPLEGTTKAILLDGRIVGGIETTIQQFPHQVSLQRNGRHFCGAVVIHSRVLLTAAHCIGQQKSEWISVRVGSAHLYQGGSVLKVRSIIPHEGYNFPTILNNDIALLILEEPLILSPFVRPIPLMTKKDVLPANSNLYVSGWGTTSSNDFQVSSRLRFTAIHEIDHNKCAASYETITKVTPTMMCAGIEQGGRDSCQGDSGGPLITRVNGSMKLLGIVSWGISCAKSGYPGVYTKVADYDDWIRHHMMEAGGFELS